MGEESALRRKRQTTDTTANEIRVRVTIEDMDDNEPTFGKQTERTTFVEGRFI